MRGYYTPEERFEVLEKAKASPAYQILASLDRLNWRDAHPILSLFQEPPVKKPKGWDERQAQIAEWDRRYINLCEQSEVLARAWGFNEENRIKMREITTAIEGITKARFGGTQP
jgi:hypothetical protein